jgi:hypothetical protein
VDSIPCSAFRWWARRTRTISSPSRLTVVCECVGARVRARLTRAGACGQSTISPSRSSVLNWWHRPVQQRRRVRSRAHLPPTAAHRATSATRRRRARRQHRSSCRTAQHRRSRPPSCGSRPTTSIRFTAAGAARAFCVRRITCVCWHSDEGMVWHGMRHGTHSGLREHFDAHAYEMFLACDCD